jgi:phospholipid/cholesterol/gamma-HCH transport system substrate-binding protein
VTGELASNEADFDALLVQGARTMQALASRSEQLTELVATADQATGAIAGQSTALSGTLRLLPAALNRSTQTFSGLRTTLDTLQPVVSAARPATTHLAELTRRLGRLASTSVPTVDALIALIHNPSGQGDLTTLLDSSPSLASLAGKVVPEVDSALNDSQPQLKYLLSYTPDVVAALTNVGQASAYYDANGHYTRTQPWFGAFGIDAANALTSQPPSDRYNGLKVVRGRCPGGAAQPSPDHSAPASAPGCTASSSPAGP